MIANVLPQCGRNRDRIEWSKSVATGEQNSRHQAVSAIRTHDESPFLTIAIDGPLKPQLRQCNAYRTAECVLSRGAFQKRGKPGQANAGSGPHLHKHATLLARMVLENCKIGTAKMPFAASSSAVYEAFPNLFLGVLCAEPDYPVRPSKGRCWTDCLFPLVASQLDKLIQTLLPQRRFTSVAATSGHEPIAALTCAVTALAAAAGQCVAVGSPTDGYIVLPPLSLWGLSEKRERWAQREL